MIHDDVLADFHAGVEQRIAQLERKPAAQLLADIRAGQTDRERAARAELLAAGRWTPAGGGLEVRLS